MIKDSCCGDLELPDSMWGSVRQNQNPPGQALVYPLIMLLKNRHVLCGYVRYVPVSDNNRTSAGSKHAADFIECIAIEPVHSIALTDADRLAIRKIGNNAVNCMVGKRERCCIPYEKC